ncbi:sensor histidine kinase [Cupriavidus basilensis]
MSHDLRTPLTRMSLRIEGVDDNQVRHRPRQDLAEMNGLIDATLYYLRERDGAAAPRQRVDVHALLQAVVDDATEIGQDVSLSGGAEPLLAYPAELRRAVVNLAENAHRYGGSARIALADSAERVVIDVCDDGPGIPPEEMARVLEPFYRLESSRNRATGGVGMGLSIAADIVSRHGGELSLANRPEGGLRVRIVLPLEPERRLVRGRYHSAGRCAAHRRELHVLRAARAMRESSTKSPTSTRACRARRRSAGVAARGATTQPAPARPRRCSQPAWRVKRARPGTASSGPRAP